jgi:carboxylesterase type B
MADLYNAFLKEANCTTASCLRNISESAMAAANARLIQNSSVGFSLGPGIGFGPVIDGDLVPNLPNVLLEQGRYHKGIKKVLSANMADEADFGPSTC